MIVVWRGWGLLVPLSVIVGFFIGAGVAGALGLGSAQNSLVLWLVTALVSWAFLGLAVRRIGSEEGPELIDEGTGRRLRTGRDAGSFFFIPTRNWMWIAPGLALVMALASLSG